MASLSDVIGTDYISEPEPLFLMDRLRGKVTILTVIKEILKKTLKKVNFVITRKLYICV